MIKIKKRGKSKIGPGLGLKDAFKEFNKTQKKDSHFHVDYKTYKNICAEFNKRIIHEILYSAATFTIPYKLGELRIQKRKMNFSKPNKLRVDWKQSNELGFRVYHMNDHRDNNRYRWYWRKKAAIIKNKTAYSFTATRTNMRELASILLKNKAIDYYE